jgi:hypothetical protein
VYVCVCFFLGNDNAAKCVTSCGLGGGGAYKQIVRRGKGGGQGKGYGVDGKRDRDESSRDHCNEPLIS